MATAAGIDVSHLRDAHEEADTLILLHAVDAKIKGYEKLIIQCRDTDVNIVASCVCTPAEPRDLDESRNC